MNTGDSSVCMVLYGSPSVLHLVPLWYAAEVLGMRQATLRKILSRHPKEFPPFYRVDHGCKRRVRYLTDQEVEEIRQWDTTK